MPAAMALAKEVGGKVRVLLCLAGRIQTPWRQAIPGRLSTAGRQDKAPAAGLTMLPARLAGPQAGPASLGAKLPWLAS